MARDKPLWQLWREVGSGCRYIFEFFQNADLGVKAKLMYPSAHPYARLLTAHLPIILSVFPLNPFPIPLLVGIFVHGNITCGAKRIIGRSGRILVPLVLFCSVLPTNRRGAL